MTDPADDTDATFVPLVVVDEKGRRRTPSPHADQPGVDDVSTDAPSPEKVSTGEMGFDELAGLAAAAAVAAGSQALRVMAVPLRVAGALAERAASGTSGQAAMRWLRSLLDEPAEEGRQELAAVAGRIEERLSRFLGVVIPAVVGSLDANDVIERIDLDALLARIDVNALLDQVDVDRLLRHVDVDALMDRVDIDALVARARIEEIVARSTSQAADSAVDLGRRQAVGLDAVIMRLVDGILGRDPDETPTGPAALAEDDPPGLR